MFIHSCTNAKDYIIYCIGVSVCVRVCVCVRVRVQKKRKANDYFRSSRLSKQHLSADGNIYEGGRYYFSPS